jgi:radical SAM protein with 4Fe4S-binding SPASM domain
MNLYSSPEIYPNKILIGIQEGNCNLKCPKCHTHGNTIVSENERPGGVMSLEDFQKIVKEIKSFHPRVAPQTWDEPLLTPNFFSYLQILKENGLVVTMDTNGLLLTEVAMNKLINLSVDSIFISVDAFYSHTYEKVRGVNKLDFLISTILKFLKLRGEKEYPRIGVSFVVEKENKNEVDSFVEFWKDKVDVVRINEKFLEGRKIENFKAETREPCWSLKDSLMIHYNGDAALCCVDNHYENNLGNVLNRSVLEVWNNEKFNHMRTLHDQGKWDETGICKDCDLWSNEKPEVQITDNHIISETKTHRYVNLKSRMDTIPKGNRYIR